MEFKLTWHDQCPEGFSVANVHKNAEAGLYHTSYKPHDDISLYNMGCHVSGDLATFCVEEEQRQKAFINVEIDTVYNGYEFLESALSPQSRSRMPKEQEQDSSQDPEKIAAGKQVIAALVEHFTQLGYGCTSAEDLPPRMTIELDERHNNDPLAEFAKINQALQDIAAAWERGEKPLGDITPPSGTIRTRQDTSPQEPEEVLARAQMQYTQLVERMGKDNALKKITDLANKHFPIGQPVTQDMHSGFAHDVGQLFSRGR